jgi:hypothetical protein
MNSEQNLLDKFLAMLIKQNIQIPHVAQDEESYCMHWSDKNQIVTCWLSKDPIEPHTVYAPTRQEPLCFDNTELDKAVQYIKENTSQ